MKKNGFSYINLKTALLFIICLLLAGMIFLGFKYVDMIFFVNDMQSGLDYRGQQIDTLKMLFNEAASNSNRSEIQKYLSIMKSNKNTILIKEFGNRIEVNNIVILFKKDKFLKVLTLSEYDTLAYKGLAGFNHNGTSQPKQ